MMRRALAALGLSLVAGLAAVPTAAQAVTGSPPVTTPDSGSLFPGNAVFLTPVNNDTDPDGDQLTICRLGTEHYKGLTPDFVGNDFAVFSRPSVKPGTYTFTYYACDYSYLTAGTITITVEALPKITVKKIASRPGKLRVTNPADFKIRFLYGSFREDRPDGRVLIAKGASAVITVHRTRIDWVAFNRKGDIFLGTGHVTNIKLPGGDRRPASNIRLSPRLAAAWRSAA
jgi:Bacterial Ig domain